MTAGLKESGAKKQKQNSWASHSDLHIEASIMDQGFWAGVSEEKENSLEENMIKTKSITT